jgi:Domain of unknown function (DUF4192)
MTLLGRHPAGSRISGPGEMLQAVPYLLGFHPQRSLVLIGLAAGRLVVTARLDLADAARGAVPHAVATMVRGGSTSFVAVVYDDDAVRDGPGPPTWAELVVAVETEVEAAEAQLLDALLVIDNRWWAYTCTDVACCPAEGQPLPSAPSAFTAAATVDGVVALPSRAALDAVLDPLPEGERDRLTALIAAAERAGARLTLDGLARRWEISVKRAIFRAARAADQPGWAGPPDDDEVARCGAALRVVAIRDAVWAAIDNRRLDGRPLWRELGRRLPSPYDAPPLFLYGWASWRAGDGASANIAADRVLASDPHYTAADLLVAAISAGVDPRRLPRLRLPKAAAAGCA